MEKSKYYKNKIFLNSLLDKKLKKKCVSCFKNNFIEFGLYIIRQNIQRTRFS